MNIDLGKGGIVIGVGTDLVEVERIRRSRERHGDRWLHKLFSEEELSYCLDMKNPYPSLAARFAVKEAVAKAFTTGIGREFGWKSVSVVHGERSQPLAKLDEQGQALLQAAGGTSVSLSLTHTTAHAMAVALILRRIDSPT